MAMRFCKEITNPEMLIKWNIKGVYNEFDLERTYCSCGHVEPSKIYVCPKCGNTEFVTVKDYTGNITSSSETEFGFDSSKKHIFRTTTWLAVKRNADQAKVDFVERPVNEVVFSEDGPSWSYRRGNVSDEELTEAIKKFKKKFSPNMQFIIDTYDSIGMNVANVREAVGSLNRNDIECVDTVKELISKGEKNYLTFLIKHYPRNTRWESADNMMRYVGIPSFLKADRNNNGILSSISSNFYNFKNNLADLEAKWKKLPMDVQLVVLHYFKQGLIDSNQLFNMSFICNELLEKHPDIQAKMIKKYFANFSLTTGRHYYYNRTNESISKMFEYYEENGLPILPDTFDFRAWRSMVNSDTIKELGYDEAQVTKLLENMDTNPLDSFLELGKLRRPRKKNPAD